MMAQTLNANGLHLGFILKQIAPTTMSKKEYAFVLAWLKRVVVWDGHVQHPYGSQHPMFVLVKDDETTGEEKLRNAVYWQVQDIAELKSHQWADKDSIRPALYGGWGIRVILMQDENLDTQQLTLELIDDARSVTNTYRFRAKEN